MTAEEAKAAVLALFPDAALSSWSKGRRQVFGDGLNGRAVRGLSGRMETDDECWIDAAAKWCNYTPPPRWMDRPSGPGLWVAVGTERMRGIDTILRLTADDIERGAPFHCLKCYGPIADPEAK